MANVVFGEAGLGSNFGGPWRSSQLGTKDSRRFDDTCQLTFSVAAFGCDHGAVALFEASQNALDLVRAGGSEPNDLADAIDVDRPRVFALRQQASDDGVQLIGGHALSPIFASR
ncbi:hypothetical protein BH09MYX1_BH09MYX1_03440 [soil metagenome]